MKFLNHLIAAVAFSCIVSAQNTETTETTEVRKNPDGTVTRDTTTTTTTFNPEARQKIVTYFSGYKGEPHGLPPAWAAKIKVEGMPVGWRSSVAKGTVITETQRSYLVEPTSDLVAVLPTRTGDVRYYMAGSNIVAVDPSYRVVDSIQIPTVRYETSTEVEVDRDKVEIEVEVDE